MLTDKRLSIVVLCYKDELNIHPLYKRLTSVMSGITENYEVVYVNDASPDNASLVLRGLASRDRRVTVITHSRNFGPQAGFTSGMRQATGDAVVLMDGDLQDPPELIEKFVKKWNEGYDVVYGVRAEREKGAGWFRRFAYKRFYRILNYLSDIEIPMDTGEFSLMDRKVVDHINALPEVGRVIRGLRAWVGFKQIGIEFVRPERHAGSSSYGLMGYLRLARNAICSFSSRPLEWISYVAAIMTIVALLGIAYFVIDSYAPINVPFLPLGSAEVPRGLRSLIILVLFFGSVQLLALSIIAEYIGRIFEESKKRPPAIKKEVINDHRK